MNQAPLRLLGAVLVLLAGLGLLLWNFSKPVAPPEATGKREPDLTSKESDARPQSTPPDDPEAPEDKALKPRPVLPRAPPQEEEAEVPPLPQPAPVAESEPGPWYSQWPTRFHPEVFAEASDHAFEDCPSDPRYRYEGVDCQSAPCLLVFQVRRDADGAPGDWEAVDTIVETCEPWASTYPTQTGRLTRCSRAMACGEHEAWTLAIAPSGAVNLLRKHQDLDPEDWKSQLQSRCADLAEELGCPE